jgi:hypothetical protein
MLKKTGIDDEAIKSGENMLLTFTNVRNEAGKNNDIFTQATKVTADLSVAFGKDMTESAILVGKALQDPIAGVTALRRVGVQLSEQQQQQIKDFVEAGDVMSAQKVILRELATEVGGSANAYGKTMAGQVAIAREELLNAGAAIITVAAPSLRVLADVVGHVAEAMQTLPHGVQTAIGVFALLAAAVGPAMTVVGGMMTLLPKLGSAFVTAGLDIAAFIERTSLAAFAMNPVVLGLAAAAAVIGLTIAIVGRSANVWDEAKAAAKGWGDTIVAGANASGDALGTLQAQQHLLNEEARAAAEAGGVSYQRVLELKAKQDELTGAIASTRQANAEAKAADAERTAGLNALVLSTEQSTQATLDAINAMQQYANQVLASQGGAVGLEAAQINLQQAQDKLTALQNSGTATALELAAAHNQVDQATLGVANAAVNASAKEDTFTAGLNQGAIPALEAMKHSLEESKARHGDNTGAIQAEIDKVSGYIYIANQVPTDKTTTAHWEDRDAVARMADYKRQIDALPASKVTELYAGIFGGVAHGAAGGIVSRPTVALIGEAGPEAVVPLHRMPGVSALGNTRSMGGGAQQTFNINITVPLGAHPAEVGAATVDAIRQYERLNGKSWRS